MLAGILETCRQQLKPATALLEPLLHLPRSQALELIQPAARSMNTPCFPGFPPRESLHAPDLVPVHRVIEG